MKKTITVYDCDVCKAETPSDKLFAIRVRKSFGGERLDKFIVDLPEHDGVFHICQYHCFPKLKAFIKLNG